MSNEAAVARAPGKPSRVVFPHVTPVFPRKDWSVFRVLSHQAKNRGDRPFLTWMPTSQMYSYAETHRLACRLCSGFAQVGVAPGDRVVLFLANSVEHLLVWFGLSALGAVDAPINTAYVGDFLVHQMNLVRAKVAVVEADLLPRILDVAPKLSFLEKILVRGAVPSTPTSHVGLEILRLEDCYRDGADQPKPPEGPQPATILYTSGTTGPSKGVVLSHSQLYFFADQTIHLHRLTQEDTIMAPVPLFHASGRIFGAYSALIAGAHYAMYEKFSGSRFVDRLYESGATVVHLLGAMMSMIFNQPPSPRDRGHKLRSVFAGPTVYAIADEFQERFGVSQIVEGLGQTEVCQPVVTPPCVRRPKGAAGVVMDQFFEARIVDPDTDEELPDGIVGEYVVRAKEPWLITLGYENMPDMTVKASRNLWFHTGDAARRDEQGWIYFVDRIKDCIRRRGENVSSYEVEAVFDAHPNVQEVAALAVKADPGDPEDEIMVCIVPNAGARIDPKEIAAWAATRMPAFAVPRYFRITPSLPKTANDKVRKTELRQQGITVDTFDRTGSKPVQASARA